MRVLGIDPGLATMGWGVVESGLHSPVFIGCGVITTPPDMRLQDRLMDRQLALTLSPEAEDRLLEQGYDPVYGARPMKRLIQSQIETQVARALIEGRAAPGDSLEVVPAQGTGFEVKVTDGTAMPSVTVE
jgi:hypothetical protein